ncbi:DUF3800 domain-containing protein [Candidatus Entotheonella palauensis]|uniref:DUF3800 domain-containing protein n=1 Tax=Candidatus Entotheonella gemina TaxID=1429439 RepID=W4M2Q5_9BACT|nr:DUF3800 domain-containing protein [Candidatus Entotheonella palauensis]ETX03912.1 MAG: hypothetical protein ETSY2_31840 [Candidatus Entotheonella gemina]
MNTPPLIRLHAYLDESGQGTLGSLFVVGAVVIERDEREELQAQLEALETRSRKGRVKWSRARFTYRQAYIRDLANLTRLSGSLFIARYTDTKQYNEMTAKAAARAIQAKAEGDYRVRVVVDGLTAGEKRQFVCTIRALGIRPDDVRGGKEQNDAFIRLADALCGLVRDNEDGQSWAVEALNRLRRRGLIVDL